jgi:serine/threonine protein kinase/Tfp pilus assembly protein PilF
MSERSATIRIPELADAAGAAPSADFAEVRTRKRELLEELRDGADDGRPLRPEDLLPRWPTDPHADPDIASLLFTDYCERQRRGEPVSASDYEQRFPEHRDSLASLLRQHGVLRSLGDASASGQTLRLPEVGEELFGFRLRRELGRGAFARVFLAEDGALADRPVVLKISEIEGDEPQTLAQLQHTHIVPIYTVHEDTRSGLRAVCMPYFGGASLSRVLEALGKTTPHPAQGRQLVEALRAVQAPAWGQHREGEAVAESGEGPGTQHSVLSTQYEGLSTKDSISNLSYIHAAAWIAAHLADALQHAHKRGVQHRDIKPSNVLLSADGQPMLLDFNLAQDARRRPGQAALGGTVAYMAPEHLRALAARDPALAGLVDHRSDIYALGMVLFEMLAGHSPFDQSASYSPLPLLIEAMALERGRTVPSLRKHRADVPWGLESIVRKCLDPEPGRRYQQAGHLAEDLRRFLDDRPLRHAPELSTAERLRKWARRHPRLTSSGAVAAAAVVLLAATAVSAAAIVTGVRQHLAFTREQLAVSRADERRRAHEDGTRRALCLVNTATGTVELTGQGRAVCEKTLALYDVLGRPDWEEHPDWRRLGADDRRRLAESTRELLLLLAWARVQTSPNTPEVLRDALALLDRAEAVRDLQPLRALAEARAGYLARLGDAAGAARARETAEHTPPHSARDHYLLAISYVHNDGPDAKARAIRELEEAVRLEPRHYWSWLQKGICHEEQGEHAAAAGDFGACIGLWPEFPWGHFNRGRSLAEGGQPAEAIKDYTAALECDPEFLLAYVNRGSTYLVLKRYEEAVADFDKVIGLTMDGAALLTAHTGRGEALEALGRTAEADAAFAAAFAGGQPVPEDVRTRALLKYGFAVHGRHPARARRAFAEVLRHQPGHAQALYGQAMVLLEREDAADLPEALLYLNRAVQAEPKFVEAYRGRGIALARLRRFDEAEQDINWCLDQEKSGRMYYAAACVSALLAEEFRRTSETPAPAQAAVNQALAFLRQALARDYGRDRAAKDVDLKALREVKEFQQLVQRP